MNFLFSDSAMIRLTTLLLIALISACSPTESSDRTIHSLELDESQIHQLARDQISRSVPDPGSTEFRNQKGQCGEVNIKTAEGTYAGFQRFVAGRALVVFERDSGVPAWEFAQIWAQLCL